MKAEQNPSPSVFASQKGSVLITAIIFASVSLVSIGSFIKLANHELRLSNTQFYSNQSLNLAEAGLDEAMHLLNSENSSGWTISGDEARLSAHDISIGRGARGEFDVLVEDWTGTEPVVTAEGRVTAASGPTSTKQVQMTLRPRSYFANGITAQCKIVFSGGQSYVESFRSSEGLLGSPAYVRRDRAAVATTSFEEDVVDIGNGHVWGYVFTGGGQPDMGPHGTVQGEDSPSSPKIDPHRVGRDFTAKFPEVLPPPSRTLPEPQGSDGTIHPTYYSNISSGTTIGIPGSTSPLVVYVDKIDMNGGNVEIVGPVVMVVSGSVKFAGGSQLRIGMDEINAEKASLLLYAYDDVSFSGNGGMKNLTRYPNNLALFGMGAEAPECSYSQVFGLGGNAAWAALVYGPNADVTMNGGGSSGIMSGAVVGMNVTINGGSKFHYDEDTEAFLRGFGFAMESWEEVAKVDRISFD